MCRTFSFSFSLSLFLSLSLSLSLFLSIRKMRPAEFHLSSLSVFPLISYICHQISKVDVWTSPRNLHGWAVGFKWNFRQTYIHDFWFWSSRKTNQRFGKLSTENLIVFSSLWLFQRKHQYSIFGAVLWMIFIAILLFIPFCLDEDHQNRFPRLLYRAISITWHERAHQKKPAALGYSGHILFTPPLPSSKETNWR